MYNESIKKIYLETISGQANYRTVISYFDKCAEIEEILQKDISLFSIAEIIGYYKSLGTTSSQYLLVINNQFGKYANWCMENGMISTGQNEFEKISAKMLSECINKQLLKAEYVTRKQLLDDITVNPRFNANEKLLVLALFEGICGKQFRELRNLRPEDFKGNVVKLCTGRSFEVSKELVNFALAAAGEIYYFDLKGRKIQYEKKDGRCLRFPTYGETVEYHYIIERLRAIKSQSEKYYYIGRDKLLKSGMICMVKDACEASGLTVNAWLHDENVKKVEAKYGKIQNISSFCKLYKDLFDDKTVDQ